MKHTVRAIFINKMNKCLLVQHNEWNLADRGKWSTVGGNIEENENLESCLTRELNEEFGTSVFKKFSVGPKIFESVQDNRIDHFFVVLFKGTDIEIHARDEILKHNWYSIEEAKNLNLYFGFEAELFSKALKIIG